MAMMPPPGHHGGQQCLDQGHLLHQVGIEAGAQVSRVELEEPGVRHVVHGVVDQHVGGTPGLQQLVGDLARPRRVGQVEAQRQGPTPWARIAASVVSRLPGTRCRTVPSRVVRGATTPSPSRRVRAVKATSWPAAARANAVSRPIPRLAPVTRATPAVVSGPPAPVAGIGVRSSR